MKFKNLVSLTAAFIVLIFSSLVSWYEGGQLRDIPWEWKYSAVFSNWINGEVADSSEILVIDHFVYAAKFEPLFPLLMAFSTLVIVFQLSAWLLKDRKTTYIIFLSLMAVGLLLFSGLLLNSPTTGLTLFSIFFGIAGIVTLLVILLHSNENGRRRKTG